MPPVGFEPTISAGERPQAAHLLKSWVHIVSFFKIQFNICLPSQSMSSKVSVFFTFPQQNPTCMSPLTPPWQTTTPSHPLSFKALTMFGEGYK